MTYIDMYHVIVGRSDFVAIRSYEENLLFFLLQPGEVLVHFTLDFLQVQLQHFKAFLQPVGPTPNITELLLSDPTKMCFVELLNRSLMWTDSIKTGYPSTVKKKNAQSITMFHLYFKQFMFKRKFFWEDHGGYVQKYFFMVF